MFALMPIALEDNEFRENYDLLGKCKNDGYSDMDEAERAAFILYDNLYRRVQSADTLATAGIKLSIPSTGNLQQLTKLNIQYAKTGTINNLDGYKGPYLDTLYECTPYVDDAAYDDDAKARFDAANHMPIGIPFFLEEDLMKGEKKNISIRRFDDLGRLMIPREIRRMLQYHESDVVEIGTVGQSIVIDRCQPLSYMDALCMQYLAAFAKSSNAACIICDTSNVVAARGISISAEPVLSAPVREHIRNLTAYEYSETDLLDLFGDGRYTVDALYPVGKTVDMPMALSFCCTTVPLRKRNKTVPGSLQTY